MLHLITPILFYVFLVGVKGRQYIITLSFKIDTKVALQNQGIKLHITLTD
jgi:hypothetical protein